jgi:hypothetical protein
LVSLSKGGAEVKTALAEPGADELFASVKVWVDLCGLGQGTPMVGWLLRRRFRTLLVRLLFWSRGYSFAALRELQRGPEGILDVPWRIPDQMTVIHVAGFPLVRHLSRPLSQRGHSRVAPLGPNDGGSTLLADLCRLPGLIYPVWGADHYLRPAGGINGLLCRLFHFISQNNAQTVGSLAPGLNPGTPWTVAPVSTGS